MARQRSLRIGYAIASGGQNYRQEALADEDARYQVLIDTATAVAGEHLDLLVFPAGYFQVRDDRALESLVRRLRRGLRRWTPGFGVVVGVDRALAASKTSRSRSSVEHPYFALYRTKVGAIVSMQQVSVSRREGARLDLVTARWGTRELLLPKTDTAFLICGESWSDDLLDRVASSGCRALVIAAHRNVNLHVGQDGYGKLSWHRRLQAFTDEHGIPVILAEHTRSPSRHPYSWPAGVSDALTPDGVPLGVTLRLATIRTAGFSVETAAPRRVRTSRRSTTAP